MVHHDWVDWAELGFIRSMSTHGLNPQRGFKRTSTPTIETVTAFPIKDGTLQMTTSSLRSRVNNQTSWGLGYSPQRQQGV